MLTITVRSDEVQFGKWLIVTFQRTLRVPDDNQTYPLPPGLGRFGIHRAANFVGRVPQAWCDGNDAFIPMYQREAMWVFFGAPTWRPHALQVGAGGVNAISGQLWQVGLASEPQNYLVCPEQLWLDGINAGDGFTRQFVAVSMGTGRTVEAQVTGQESIGGVQIRAFDSKPGRFPAKPPQRGEVSTLKSYRPLKAPSPMGLGAGGKIRQKIYPDRYGIETWDETSKTSLIVHIVNTEEYRGITGLQPPATPVDAETYTRHGLPWFELYDEDKGAVAAGEVLAKVNSVEQIDADQGVGTPDKSIDAARMRVKKIKRGRKH